MLLMHNALILQVILCNGLVAKTLLYKKEKSGRQELKNVY